MIIHLPEIEHSVYISLDLFESTIPCFTLSYFYRLPSTEMGFRRVSGKSDGYKR